MLGVDYARGGWRAGVALMRTDGSSGYSGAASQGKLDANLAAAPLRAA